MIMQVFVLRHGHAESQITTDEARNLSDKGRDQVAAAAHYSLSELIHIQEIWASPLVRAQQTAQILRDVLFVQGVHVPLKTIDIITPESDPAGLFDLLQTANLHSVLLVSHQPFVSDFIDLLCGSARGFHPMNTSSLALIGCDVAAVACGELRWLRHV
jgi:phosphohistidine phosphatase